MFIGEHLGEEAELFIAIVAPRKQVVDKLLV